MKRQAVWWGPPEAALKSSLSPTSPGTNRPVLNILCAGTVALVCRCLHVFTVQAAASLHRSQFLGAGSRHQ